MKKLILAVLLCAIPVCALAGGLLERDLNNREAIQGFAPNGKLSSLLTVNSTTVDMRSYAAFQVYSPVACQIRFMATSSKAGSIAEPVTATNWETYVVNRNTPFVNFSGCTGGYRRGM